mmetsp:Transcript_10152/g.16325  ORF Transcript_10152/g.16325 Transcript_10152/m.16325 type:complete len:231 (+) Transcript_10152:423-1115(+)
MYKLLHCHFVICGEIVIAQHIGHQKDIRVRFLRRSVKLTVVITIFLHFRVLDRQTSLHVGVDRFCVELLIEEQGRGELLEFVVLAHIVQVHGFGVDAIPVLGPITERLVKLPQIALIQEPHLHAALHGLAQLIHPQFAQLVVGGDQHPGSIRRDDLDGILVAVLLFVAVPDNRHVLEVDGAFELLLCFVLVIAQFLEIRECEPALPPRRDTVALLDQPTAVDHAAEDHAR